jgi:hypothetical protein
MQEPQSHADSNTEKWDLKRRGVLRRAKWRQILEDWDPNAEEVLAAYGRPTTRLECPPKDTPCPYVGCRYHLYLDVSEETGHISLNFPDKEPWELERWCALNVAEKEGRHTLQEVGGLLRLTRERVRQIEEIALSDLRSRRVDGKTLFDALV